MALQLDNKKLEALPKGKDRNPVMQVSFLQYFMYFMVIGISVFTIFGWN